MSKFVTVNNGWQFLKLSNLNIFVKSDFNKAFDIFWSTTMNDLDKSQVVGLLLKVKGSDDNYRSLGPLFKYTKSDRIKLRRVLMDYINLKANNYSTITID